MGMLLAFAPFIAFAVVERLAGSTAGLIAGALVATCLLLRDLIKGSTPKVLEVGTAILFAGLALYALLIRPAWSVIGVRLVVDAGLLLIVLGSMALRRPFTMQYAREQVAPELWDSAEFVRTNYVITSVWGLAFAVMVAAELALLTVPGMPPRLGIAAIILALVGAVRFTGWYPDRVKARTTS
ncbi:MAG: hypothetical protein U1E52_04595 [Geminicoccaceae bacterium]